MSDQNIYVIIDGSGSMSGVKNDVVKGINEFITEQQTDATKNNTSVKFSLTTFDNQIMEVYDGEDLSLVNPLTLADTFLGGGTALLDAIGKTLTNAEDNAAPRNVVVVYTDGAENQSTEFTHDQISKLIEKLTKTGKWQFVYLGAEFGAFAKDRAQYAMASSASAGTYSSMNTSKGQVTNTMRRLSDTVSHYRNADESQLRNVQVSGLVAAATMDASVDWDGVKEPVVTEPTSVKATSRRTSGKKTEKKA